MVQNHEGITWDTTGIPIKAGYPYVNDSRTVVSSVNTIQSTVPYRTRTSTQRGGYSYEYELVLVSGTVGSATPDPDPDQIVQIRTCRVLPSQEHHQRKQWHQEGATHCLPLYSTPWWHLVARQ